MGSLQQLARSMAWKRHIPGYKAWNRLFYRREYPALARTVFGIDFPHPVGLAPVLERQTDLLDECASLGFAFCGIAPAQTPVKEIAERLSDRKSGILASIELRAEGAAEDQACQDLIRTYSLLYDFADFFTVDINRQTGLSSMDDLSDWWDLLDELLSLRLCYERYKPILMRIPPTYSEEQQARLLDFCLLSGIDGIVAAGPVGVRKSVAYTKGRLPVVGSGAITVPEDAVALLQAGASLVEVAQGIPAHPAATSKRLLAAIDNLHPNI